MAEITAKAVNELRKRTGLGLMECKALLKEADGDIKQAETLAKEKGRSRAPAAPAAPPTPAASRWPWPTTARPARSSS